MTPNINKMKTAIIAICTYWIIRGNVSICTVLGWEQYQLLRTVMQGISEVNSTLFDMLNSNK